MTPLPRRTEPSAREEGICFHTVCTRCGHVYYAGLVTDGVARALDGVCRQCEAKQELRDAALGRYVRRAVWWLPWLLVAIGIGAAWAVWE